MIRKEEKKRECSESLYELAKNELAKRPSLLMISATYEKINEWKDTTIPTQVIFEHFTIHMVNDLFKRKCLDQMPDFDTSAIFVRLTQGQYQSILRALQTQAKVQKSVDLTKRFAMEVLDSPTISPTKKANSQPHYVFPHSGQHTRHQSTHISKANTRATLKRIAKITAPSPKNFTEEPPLVTIEKGISSKFEELQQAAKEMQERKYVREEPLTKAMVQRARFLLEQISLFLAEKYYQSKRLVELQDLVNRQTMAIQAKKMKEAEGKSKLSSSFYRSSNRDLQSSFSEIKGISGFGHRSNLAGNQTTAARFRKSADTKAIGFSGFTSKLTGASVEKIDTVDPEDKDKLRENSSSRKSKSPDTDQISSEQPGSGEREQSGSTKPIAAFEPKWNPIVGGSVAKKGILRPIGRIQMPAIQDGIEEENMETEALLLQSLDKQVPETNKKSRLTIILPEDSETDQGKEPTKKTNPDTSILGKTQPSTNHQRQYSATPQFVGRRSLRAKPSILKQTKTSRIKVGDGVESSSKRDIQDTSIMMSPNLLATQQPEENMTIEKIIQQKQMVERFFNNRFNRIRRLRTGKSGTIKVTQAASQLPSPNLEVTPNSELQEGGRLQGPGAFKLRLYTATDLSDFKQPLSSPVPQGADLKTLKVMKLLRPPVPDKQVPEGSPQAPYSSIEEEQEFFEKTPMEGTKQPVKKKFGFVLHPTNNESDSSSISSKDSLPGKSENAGFVPQNNLSKRSISSPLPSLPPPLSQNPQQSNRRTSGELSTISLVIPQKHKSVAPAPAPAKPVLHVDLERLASEQDQGLAFDRNGDGITPISTIPRDLNSPSGRFTMRQDTIAQQTKEDLQFLAAGLMSVREDPKPYPTQPTAPTQEKTSRLSFEYLKMESILKKRRLANTIEDARLRSSQMYNSNSAESRAFLIKSTYHPKHIKPTTDEKLELKKSKRSGSWRV